MSNHYVSKCCNQEAKYISSGEKSAIGQCTKCLEVGELTAVIDLDSVFRKKHEDLIT